MINIAQLNNEQVVQYAKDRLAQYEEAQAMTGATNLTVYGNIATLKEMAALEKALQGCRIFGVDNAAEVQDKISSILKRDGTMMTREVKSLDANALTQYYKDTNQFHYFRDIK